MANKIRIDTRLLDVNWTTGTSYRLELGPGLVREVGNNRSFSAAQSNAKTFTTFDSGPTISAVSPAVGTTGSFATTATISFNRTIYENTTPSEFYLYREIPGGTDELIATLTTASSRVTRVGNTATINLKDLVDSSSTYYFQSSANPVYVDMFKFPNETFNKNNFKYSTARPNIEFVIPSFNTTGSFATTATINFDRNIKKRNGNVRLYKETVGSPELIATLATTSNRVSVSGDQIVLDLKDLVDGNGTYYLESDYGFVDDALVNFRAEPITNQKFRYSTSRPNIDDVSPDYSTVNSFSTTAVISFDRTIKKRNGSIRLYKEVINGDDILVETISVNDSRVSVANDTITIDLRYLLNGSSTYYLLGDIDFVDDVQTNFKAEQIKESNFKYSTAPGPIPIAVTPPRPTTGTFVSTATITFNKNIELYQNNFYLYNSAGAYRTIPINSSSLRVVNGNRIEITLFNEPIPENTYWIGYDLGAIIDSNTFSANQVTTDGLITWTSKSLSDLNPLSYNSRITSPVFSGNWYSILDRSPETNEQYTLTLTATSGTFTATIGTVVGNTWTYTSTRQNIEAVSNLQFIANVKNLNWDLPLTTTLSRDGVQVATRSNLLIGEPYDLASMPLVSNSATNSVGSSTVLTVTANTNSSISSQVTFRSDSQIFGTSTFVNNVASFTIPPNTANTGTFTVFAQWDGQTIVPKFNGRNSDSIQQTFLPRAPITLTLSASPSPYFYHRLTGTDFDLFNTATITISGMIYDNHKPTGSIQLLYNNAVIQTQPLPAIPNGTTSTSTTITWQPWQDTTLSNTPRTLRVIYNGDFWNREAGATTSLIAAVKRSPGTITMSPQRTFTYFQNYTITATVSTSNIDGKPITFKVNGNTLGTGTVVNSVATATFYATPQTHPEGVYTFTGEFTEDFNCFGAIGSMSNVVERIDAVFFGQFYPGENRLDPIMIPSPPNYTTSTVLTSYIVSSLPEFENTTTATVYVDWWIDALMPTGDSERISLGSRPFVGSSSTVVVNLGTLPRFAGQSSRPGVPTDLVYGIRAEIKGIDSQSYEVLPPRLSAGYNFFRNFFVGL